MRLNWPFGPWKYALACLGLAWCAGIGRAGEDALDLRAIVEKQQQQIMELQKRLDTQPNPGVQAAQAAAPGGNDAAAPAENGRVVIDDAQIKQIIADYLQQNPGAGMPNGVQSGYSNATGFTLRSPQNPAYANWADEGNIPFELRIRGRVQIPYIFYKVNDNINHLTGGLTYPTTTQNAASNGQLATGNPTGFKGANNFGDYSQLEVKRLRLIWEGTAFDPNFRYHFELDATTRGLGDTNTGYGTVNPGDNFGGTGNGGLVDNAVRLLSAFVAYDFHPCCNSEGCAPKCPDGTYNYSPTFTVLGGKLKPYFANEEVFGSANAQFVEFGMVEWFFDADDDNLLNWWGVQYRGMQDRLFLTCGVTNGNETQIPNLAMDDYPGLNAGFWYDFGGTWNEQRHRYDLFGDCMSDIDYSCKPVVRVGGAINFVWADSKAIYGSAEDGRQRTAWAAPGGSNLQGLLNGGGVTAGNGSALGMDKSDEYTYETYIAAKYHGFSLHNDWFFRYYDNFQGVNGPGGVVEPILYSATGQVTNAKTGSGVAAPGTTNNVVGLFRPGGCFDYGQQLALGYFIVPKKLEIVARWGYINGQSGNIYGNGTFVAGPTVTYVSNQTGGTSTQKTVIFNDTFKEFHESDEYTIGINRFFRRQQLKWQNDLGYYRGGNPASGGQSPAGFIPGTDGYMFRTQITFMF